MTVRLQLYDAIAQGQCYSVRPVLSVEFSNCRLHVLINRSLGDPENATDFRRGFSVCHPLQDFGLASGEHGFLRFAA